jgi:hypothetical protein
MGKSSRVAYYYTDTGAAFTARGELFHASLIQGGRRSTAILDEYFCEFTTSRHRRGENAFNNALFQKGFSSHKSIVVAT